MTENPSSDITSETTSETGADLRTESHDPAVPPAYAAFMRKGWGDRELDMPRHPVADHAAARRRKLAEAFPDDRLVIPAGTFKVRSNDTDYRFRPDTAHTYFSGNQTSDAVLVIEPGSDGVDGAALYARPRSDRDTDEFFRDRQYGELWAGRRPSAREIGDSLGIEVRHVKDLPSYDDDRKTRDITSDEDLARVADELRLVKDEWEVGELQEACDITTLGFEDSVREWDRVLELGERWIEGTFFRRARAMGNDIGYDSICAGGSHATTLHWIDNTGAIEPGKLVLLDMGVEGRNLYTADVTRTLPVDGRFTPLQRDLYDLVLNAQQAGIDAVRPGVPFLAAHHAAMEVLAHGLGDLGLLPAQWRRRSTPTPRSMPAGPSTARPTCSAWTSTTAPARRSTSTPRATWPRGWCSRWSPASTSRRTTCSSPRSCAASASASRTTSSSPPTGAGTSRPRCPARPPTWRSGWADTSVLECHHYDAFRCRSCTLLEVPRTRQLLDKEAHARSLIEARVWLPTVSGPDAGFRNKAKMVVGGTAAAPTLGHPRP